MALPATVDPTTPAGTDSPAGGDDHFRDLKAFILEFLLGATAGASYTGNAKASIVDVAGQWPTHVRLTNKSGGSTAVGDAVIIDTSNDSAIVNSTTKGVLAQIVVAREVIANTAAGLFARTGVVTVNTTGAVTRGDWLWKSATTKTLESVGFGAATAAPPAASVAMALADAAGGTCTVLLFGNTQVAPGSLGCRVRNSATVALASGATTVLTFDTERYDPAGMHSTSVNTARITVPLAGIYVATAHVSLENLATDDYNEIVLSIELNGNAAHTGTPLAAQSWFDADAASLNTSPQFSVTTFYKLAANDYLEAYVYQSNAGATGSTALVASASSPEFAVHYLGL